MLLQKNGADWEKTATQQSSESGFSGGTGGSMSTKGYGWEK